MVFRALQPENLVLRLAALAFGGLQFVLGGGEFPARRLLGSLGGGEFFPQACGLWSLRSSAARLSTPAFREMEPPVMEPPRLMTCPSSVTIRKALRYFRAMAMPQSRSSTITVLPKRFCTIF